MKVDVLSLTKTSMGKRDLPSQFNEPVRPDLIKRAVEAIQSHKRQKYGTDPEAGMKASAELSRRRRKYRGSYGHGISRVPRKILSRRGTRFNWVGAVAPGTVGGRKAHPPKTYKEWVRKINKKERRKAIRSALAATMLPELVKARGHVVPDDYPFIIESKAESLSRTKEVVDALEKLGFKGELERTSERKVRAGKGKLRGRKYRVKKGPLLVVSGDCPLLRSAENILGIDVVDIKNVNAELLAPGADAGRLTIFTEKAIEVLDKKALFTNDHQKDIETKAKK
jgi:large subunit ribosomal protein L4e